MSLTRRHRPNHESVDDLEIAEGGAERIGLGIEKLFRGDALRLVWVRCGHG
ncbi:hypothetical protein [Nocardia salmonicida]|uniref:hypothetical protein n=1 Tax=Nocardia salmonicida TaxID=53431 RepID=UPI0033E7DC11